MNVWEQDRIYINREWNFGGKIVDIPHTFIQTPLHYFDESCYQMEGSYCKRIRPREEWRGKQVLLTVDGAAHSAEVIFNGQLLGRHQNGYTAFTVNLTAAMKFGEENELEIKVNSSEKQNIPPFGKVIDYMTYGGIYREIYLTVKETQYIEDLFVCNEKAEGSRAEFVTQVSLKNCKGKQAEVRFSLYETGENQEKTGRKIKDLKSITGTGENGILKVSQQVEQIQLWSVEQPTLYYVLAELYLEGEKKDEKIVRTGFRTTVFKEDGFYLNGKKTKLRGLNRHQSYPYFGYAMPKRAQWADADILKKELAVNAVRTSHYPQSHAFLERCDEIGLLVFTEIPGWQHIGDEAWKEQACENVKEMVLQYRNHPSVFLWGVRINESVDDDAFYEKTNAIAHKLDSSRSTGGVRFLQKSHLLEDVYTYNDFLHNGLNKGADTKKKVTSDMRKGYLVSEFNGHMYPTKSFDSEEHRVEHALRHARVLNEIYKQKDIAGGFGWCMSDYNTHKDFGSGDRICYHGVLDMFRNKKLAAFVYASQGEEIPVFEISSSMDIGEHPACNLGEVYAFTNADSVKVYKNDEFIREFFPDREQFGALPHPPIRIDDFIGELMEKKEGYSKKKSDAIKEVLLAIQKYGQNSLPVLYYLKMVKLMITEHMTVASGYELYSKYVANWGDKVTTYRFEAMKDGKVVGEIRKTPFTETKLELCTDTLLLEEEETYDSASVRMVMRDENGNVLPFYQEPVRLKAEGAVEIMGPDIISLKGGMGGTYVKTKGQSGEGKLTVTADGKNYEICFQVKKREE